MKIRKWVLKIMRKPAKRIDRFFHHLFSAESGTLSPLAGDRCIEYAFVIENIKDFDRESRMLDVGCAGSTLTTIIRSLGFKEVTGIDLNKSPVKYKDVQFLCGNICTAKLPEAFYDVIIFCSTIEHIGLAGRYGSSEIPEGDIITLKVAKNILKQTGKLILTIPYGIPKTIRPYHRVYNRDSTFLKYMFKKYDIIKQEYYKNNSDNIWEICSENEAAKVVPTENSYALGLFVLKMRSSRRL